MAPVLELAEVPPSLPPPVAAALVGELAADFDRDPRAVLFEWCTALHDRVQVCSAPAISRNHGASLHFRLGLCFRPLRSRHWRRSQAA